MRFIRHLTSTGPAWAALTPDGATRAVKGDLLGEYHVTETPVTPTKVLAPIAPTNIIGIGLNYRKHAEEGGKAVPERPMWFMKTTGSLQHPGDPIQLPSCTENTDYEGELVIVIGRDARNVSPEDAIDHVLGYTIAIDVSARDWQFKLGGGQFNHGKSFDTFCPLGPMLVTPDELTDPDNLRLVTRINGEVRQDSTTADMVFDVRTLVSFLSTDRTLPAGTIILTGTPSGVGYARKPPVWLQDGDTVEVEIQGIGTLSNPVQG
ncbi:fumarylacetoacetate hydrolase family protein [Synoicihabitans lomoniglobus]|uniref:Fumarylacetoacetate hydrolase family protein n=1 Tax=Synoicihabitans lomoniglobus TaxID=2909285 RepID=A0AAF0A0V2_9BACT|nr:fumarylacetoacetate hydrolase family protein [Opitutaceae bacterium LMO-M01]WED65293.1 fumarylacetoacetate hydrolase family protein [Opitutaceae bacterium LMO-M01]